VKGSETANSHKAAIQRGTNGALVASPASGTTTQKKKED